VKIVVNATPLIALSLVNQLQLLKELFDEVFLALANHEADTLIAKTAKMYSFFYSQQALIFSKKIG
jgi:predicted nucleic acid-binding protein